MYYKIKTINNLIKPFGAAQVMNIETNFVVFIYNDTLTGYGEYTEQEIHQYNGVSRLEIFTNEKDMLDRVEELENQ